MNSTTFSFPRNHFNYRHSVSQFSAIECEPGFPPFKIIKTELFWLVDKY